MPVEIINSLAIVKRSCAKVNCELGILSKKEREI